MNTISKEQQVGLLREQIQAEYNAGRNALAGPTASQDLAMRARRIAQCEKRLAELVGSQNSAAVVWSVLQPQ